MFNSSTNPLRRQSLRRARRGFIWLALVVALGLASTEAARAATITVSAGGNVQAALDQAQPGDTIMLEAGASFVGPFVLPNKVGTGWITVRTSAPDSSLPPAGHRITPAYASVLPKLLSPGGGHPAVHTDPGAHHYRFVGVEFRTVDSAALVFDLVKLGDSGASQDVPAEVPHHLVLDRCYVHAFPDQGLKRGILLNSADTDILNSYVEGFKTIGQDAQAAGGWNGPGPFRIVNNYLEGAGQNLIFGGADPSIPNLVPSDIEIRNNHFFKPPAWKNPLVPRVNNTAASLQPDANSTLVPGTRYYYRVVAQFNGFNGSPSTPAEGTEVFADAVAGQAVRVSWGAWSHGPYAATRYFVQRTTQPPGGPRDWKWFAPVTTLSFADGGQAGTTEFAVEAQWAVKNIFELKNARRVVVEGNVFEYNWGHAQTGEAILFTVRNQDGAAPWSTVEDVLFRYNVVGHVGGAFNILGRDYNHPSEQAKRITIAHNLCYDVSAAAWMGRGEFLIMTGGSADVRIDHNTILHDGAITLLDDDPHTGFVFTNNIAAHNEFGVFGNGTGSGTPALERYAPGYVFRRNLIAGANPNSYPPDNYYPPASEFDAQFVNRAAGNYRLAPTSCGSMASACNPRGGTDGKDVGVDIDALNAATAGAVSGVYGRTNVALAANGGVASASSTHSSGNYPAAAVNNGDRKGLDWGAGGGWNDNTINQYPDWVQVEFGGSKTIEEVDVFTLQDNVANPAEPTDAQTFSLYGVTAFDVQYWDGAAWVAVPGGSVTGNNKVWRKFTFAPVTTTKVRVLVNSSLDQWSRVTELEAWQVSRTNHALAANGATASASSTHSSGNFPAAAAINGERRGLNWGAGGGWNDATLNQYPDWLEVNFQGARRVDEVSVFTAQDAIFSPAEPTEQMTFSLYGVTAFDVEYWNGSQWVTVPGGNVTGNNKVWRKLTFAEVTTTKIRVRVNSALDDYSRLMEVEAWGPF